MRRLMGWGPWLGAIVLSGLLLGCRGGGGRPPDVPGQPGGWDTELALPAAEDLDPSPSVVEINLVATPSTLELKPGVSTALWTYNGTVPGPLIRARKGDRLVVHFTNALPEPTTIHWHGVRVPAEMDGSPEVQRAVQPGETFEYAFTLPDAGTFWYHPHVRSSAQVGAGLYGAILVEDPEAPWLGDPLVLVLSDMSLEADGSLSPGDSSGWFGDYFGREGALLLVNGRRLPRLKARAGVPQRWHLINAARARYQRFSVPGHQLVRVGGDGGLLERPTPVPEVVLVPGERAEVVVLPRPQPAGPATIRWEDSDRLGLPSPRPPEDLFVFEVVGTPPATPAPTPPATLRTLAPVDVSGAPTQALTLGEKVQDGVTVLTINGKTAAEAEPLHAQAGTNAVWTVLNDTDYDHPFHLHGFFFQVLDVDGKPPPVREWKDTLNIRPGQTARLAVVFDDRPGMWMYHCHILDHAELGMMGMVRVMR